MWKDLGVGLLAGAGILAMSPAAANDLNLSGFYVGAAATAARFAVDSGGNNTVGPFTNADCFPPEGAPNLCADTNWSPAGSLLVGFENLADLGAQTSLRIEGEVTFYGNANFVTGSFPGASPFTFFYETTVTNIRAGFANVYIDHAVSEKVSLFAGGGIGSASMTVATNDGVVQALPQSNVNLAFNVGFGASHEVASGLDVFGQVRYVNFGTADVGLTAIAGGAPAGNYTLSTSSTELRFGVRKSF